MRFMIIMLTVNRNLIRRLNRNQIIRIMLTTKPELRGTRILRTLNNLERNPLVRTRNFLNRVHSKRTPRPQNHAPRNRFRRIFTGTSNLGGLYPLMTDGRQSPRFKRGLRRAHVRNLTMIILNAIRNKRERLTTFRRLLNTTIQPPITRQFRHRMKTRNANPVTGRTDRIINTPTLNHVRRRKNIRPRTITGRIVIGNPRNRRKQGMNNFDTRNNKITVDICAVARR